MSHWNGRQTKILRGDWIRMSRTCQGCAYLTFCQAGIDGDLAGVHKGVASPE